MQITRAYTVALYLLSLAASALPSGHCSAENTAKVPLSLVATGIRYGTNAATDQAGALDRVDVFRSCRSPYAG